MTFIFSWEPFLQRMYTKKLQWFLQYWSLFYFNFLKTLEKKLRRVIFQMFIKDEISICQKPKSVKAIYIHGFESFYYSLSENDMSYRGLSHRSWDISNWNLKKGSQNLNIRSNSLCCSGLFWTSFWFLQVSQ